MLIGYVNLIMVVCVIWIGVVDYLVKLVDVD